MAKGDVSAGTEASQQWHGLALCPMPCAQEPLGAANGGYRCHVRKPVGYRAERQ